MQSNARLLTGVKIDKSRLSARLDRLRNASVKQVGIAFSESILNIESNLKLPHALMDRTMALMAVTQRLNELRQRQPNLTDEEIVDRFAGGIWDEVTENSASRAHFKKAAFQELESLLKQSDLLREAVKSMLRSNVALAWSAFECLAEDLAQAKNKHGSKLGFRSLDSIRKSYAIIFGNNPKLARILGRRNLRTLEQIRHVVMHKGGRVDAAFIQKTGRKLKPGKRLVLTASAVSRHTNAAISAGIGLLRFCDL